MNTSILPEVLLSAPAREQPRMASEIGVEAAAKYLHSHSPTKKDVGRLRSVEPILLAALVGGILAGRLLAFGRK